MREDGGPAFPITDAGGKATAQGMCQRDYLAARFLGAIISANGIYAYEDGSDSRLSQARLAYQYADAMLKARGM